MPAPSNTPQFNPLPPSLSDPQLANAPSGAPIRAVPASLDERSHLSCFDFFREPCKVIWRAARPGEWSDRRAGAAVNFTNTAT
jgi:hypothetical protein